MDLNEFNDYYINNLLDKLSKENKTVFLLSDFNIDLLNSAFNVITPNNISGNITATILDHLPQFLIPPDIFSNPPSTKLNIFEGDWSKFD